MELIEKLAQKLGANVNSVTEEQFEDLSTRTIMASTKTGKTVSREQIMKKLRK